MNKKLPEYFLGKLELVGTVAFAVLFAVVFLNIYVPIAETAWFDFSSSGAFLFTAAFIVSSTVLLVLSRVLMYYSKNWFQLTYLSYVIWCFSEILLLCILYTVITIFVVGPEDIDPLRVLRSSFLYGFLALALPYTFAGMYLAILDKNKTISQLTSRAVGRSSARQTAGKDRITLYDSGGSMKLSVQSSNLYYIESDDNYIKVWYSDSKDVLQTRMIRCRLKTLEDSFKGTSMIRCNRKYIVNMDRVKILSKEAAGYFLDLGNPDIAPIAVTKTYQANVLSKVSAANK